MSARIGAALAATLMLSACQTREAPADYLEYSSARDAGTTASHLADNVRACWFAGARAASFTGYSYAPELNSYSGRPRVLIVPKQDPGGLPKLVIEASKNESGSAVRLFGPLLAGPQAELIRRDVAHWTRGGSGCA